MHALWKAAALVAAGTLAQAASAACYVVYAPDNTVVYRSLQPPVDLSQPLHVTMPQAAPGGRLVFALEPTGCELEIHKLDTLHAMAQAAQARPSPAPRSARRARGV